MPTAATKKRAAKPTKPGLVVFTDLDGTLLDFHTYSHAVATAALRELKRLNVPLVIVSSKTRAEILPLHKALSLETPFIAENGAAIFWPKAAAPIKPRGARERDGLWVREFGVPYASVRKRLIAYREQSGVKCEGFGDWTPEVIAQYAEIPIHLAPLAKKREYEEPFLFRPALSESTTQNHLRELAADGLTVITGGRFYHLTGKTDKGHAVAELIRWYATSLKIKPRTLAFGDSPNDWAMMAACDIGIAVKRPDGKYHPGLRAHRGIRLAGAPGPEGFNRMVLRLLKQML
ncbi:MAG: HAD-IIB family hydrolase [Candidatus Zixiibacteriota bacterium]